MVEVRWSLGLVCATIASIALGGSLAAAAEKKIVLEGKFGQVVSNSLSKLDPPADVELAQEVRVDHLTSADPEWNDATLTVYEQNLSYPSHGTTRAYGIINTKAGDTAYLELAGKWDVVNREGKFFEAPFEGQGRLLGGTGKLQGISGPVIVNGKVSADQVGTAAADAAAATESVGCAGGGRLHHARRIQSEARGHPQRNVRTNRRVTCAPAGTAHRHQIGIWPVAA